MKSSLDNDPCPLDNSEQKANSLKRIVMVETIVAQQTAETIFQAWLREMDDRRLESEALTWIWLSETHNSNPWDEELWRRDCVRSECQRRQKPEIFLRAENNILAQIRRTAE